VAILAAVTPKLLTACEAGQREPSLMAAVALAQVLDETPEDQVGHLGMPSRHALGLLSSPPEDAPHPPPTLKDIDKWVTWVGYGEMAAEFSHRVSRIAAESHAYPAERWFPGASELVEALSVPGYLLDVRLRYPDAFPAVEVLELFYRGGAVLDTEVRRIVADVLVSRVGHRPSREIMLSAPLSSLADTIRTQLGACGSPPPSTWTR
jgi:hypothetical protein